MFSTCLYFNKLIHNQTKSLSYTHTKMLLILTSCIFVILAWYIYKKLTFWQKQGIPTPGFFYLWYYFRQGVGPYDQELNKKLGNIYGTYEGLTPILFITEPDLIKEILITQFINFPNHRPFKSGIDIIDKNLFLLTGEDWKRIRSILTCTFTSGKLRRMEYLIHDAIQVMLDHLSKIEKKKYPINIRKFYNSLSYDIIMRCAYGSKIDILSHPNNPISQNLKCIFKLRWEFIFIILFPRLGTYFGIKERALKPFKFFENLTNQLINERKCSTKIHNNDFLQIMIDANTREQENTLERDDLKLSGKSISNIEMTAQSLAFLIAGFDTTSTIMTCCAYYLAKYPNVQDKLICEVSQLSSVTYDTLLELKYLEAFLKECFRLSPPVVRIERQCIATTQIGKIQVQPGTIISFPIFAIQRDPKQYTNPEVFDPDRFLEGGNDVNHHAFAYLPFGGGPRVCTGQRFILLEVKMALALILQKFRFEETPETKLRYKFGCFMLAPKDIIVQVKAHSQHWNLKNHQFPGSCQHSEFRHHY